MRSFQARGTLWTDVDHIVETPFFVDSELTRMVQIADLCAYALRRYVDAASATSSTCSSVVLIATATRLWAFVISPARIVVARSATTTVPNTTSLAFD